MDAMEFAKTVRKICRSHTSCVECEFVKVQGHCGITNPEADHAGMVAVAEQWAREHVEKGTEEESRNVLELMVALTDKVDRLAEKMDAQTGEVATVVHAHWVYKRRRSGGFRLRRGLMKNWESVEVLIDEREDTMEPFYSVCGAHNDSTNDSNMRYCPHCGAKMDGEAQNEKPQG